MNRTITLLALIGLSFSLIAPAGVQAQYVPGGSYQQSCSNIRVRGNRLTASCTDSSGNSVRTSLNINRCNGSDIANVNGQLTCQTNGNYYGNQYYGNRYRYRNSYGYGYGTPPSGSYQQSCSNARLRGNTLTATCVDSYGTQVRSSINVSRCTNRDIANVNGRLSCRRYGY
ncbi:MAG: CVNH domain-containing protein [Candidatus Eremiobacteraeota bacterium]|nr:CVNH domain-containing protein [Candidatus Eremiobacteraeota bacterium]